VPFARAVATPGDSTSNSRTSVALMRAAREPSPG
jgi:hypothetical protein